MLKRKQKELTPEQIEEIRTKDFFDMILPGTVRFMSDHYIVGDSYRCVWAIREYPAVTTEQAILARLADKNGITLRIYNRLVSHIERSKIFQNATRRNKMKSTSNDITETIAAEENLQDIITIAAAFFDIYLSWCVFHRIVLQSEFLKCKKSRWRGGERHRISETALRHYPTKLDKRKTAKAL